MVDWSWNYNTTVTKRTFLLLGLVDPEDECTTILQNITICHLTWRDISEDMNLQQHNCQNPNLATQNICIEIFSSKNH
jgi:hypothetical protein